MIRPSGYIASNDVSVKCRVARSETCSNPHWEPPVDMICTMRTWKGTEKEDPELVLQPFVELEHVRSLEQKYVTKNYHVRSSSEGRRRRSRSNSASSRQLWACDERQEAEPTVGQISQQPFSIPVVQEVVVVESHHNNNHMYFTTRSMGFLEFNFASPNAHDVVLAFLSNTLPSERIISQTMIQRSVDHSASFDVEALQATRMQQRVQSETLSEKVRRKMRHMANRIGELSATFSECAACGCDVASPDKEPYHTNPATTNLNNHGDDSRRQSPSPPPRFDFPLELEVEHSCGPTLSRDGESSCCPSVV